MDVMKVLDQIYWVSMARTVFGLGIGMERSWLMKSEFQKPATKLMINNYESGEAVSG